MLQSVHHRNSRATHRQHDTVILHEGPDAHVLVYRLCHYDCARSHRSALVSPSLDSHLPLSDSMVAALKTSAEILKTIFENACDRNDDTPLESMPLVMLPTDTPTAAVSPAQDEPPQEPRVAIEASHPTETIPPSQNEEPVPQPRVSVDTLTVAVNAAPEPRVPTILIAPLVALPPERKIYRKAIRNRNIAA